MFDVKHELGDRTWANWKKTLKKNILVAGFAAEASAVFTKQIVSKGGRSRYANIDEARKALEPLGFNDEEYFQWACVKDTDAAREAYMWFYKFISLVGDNAPNRKDKIQIPGIYTQESIHAIYKHHILTWYTGNEHEPLDLRSFEEMWHNIFPNVSITKYCQVSGKCYHCHSLYERQEVFTCEEDLENIRKLATIHKIMIEMQRGAYMRNRELAQSHPNLYMSLIMDGMSQDHCILPFLAQQDKNNIVVKQKIIGAKQHGFSKTIYRLFPHVNTGGNVACEVLLHEIEKRIDYCIENNLPFPRWLFLQIDGGSENTSRTFYALCEDLVRQGVFDRIEAARLPVGHTHEDIDAMFGVLWRAAQGKTIVSPQQWKKMAMAAFNATSED